jgi:hypothetical protein
MARKKNPAAYQVSLSAVKNIHFAKRGMAITKHAMPHPTVMRGAFLTQRTITIRKNTISCGFMIALMNILVYKKINLLIYLFEKY